MIRQHATDTLRRAFAPRGHSDALVVLQQRFDMPDDGLEHVGAALRPLRREIAAELAAGIDGVVRLRRLERRQRPHIAMRKRRVPVRRSQIQLRLLQRIIRRRAGVLLRVVLSAEKLAACFIIVRDQFEPRRFHFLNLMREEDQRIRRVVEQCFQMVMEQRQPVLHALVLAAGAHGPVKRIVAVGGTESRHIARAEPADGLRVQRRFGGRQQFDLRHLLGGELRLGIEFADGVQRRAEEIEPQRLVHTRRPQIDDAAAQREIARLAHGGSARIAVAREERDQRVMLDHIADMRAQSSPARWQIARRHALQHRVDRGDDHRRPVLAPREHGQRRQPLAFDVRLGRHAVIGQAIPGGKRQHRRARARRSRSRPSSAVCACTSSAGDEEQQARCGAGRLRRRDRRRSRRACR